MKQRPEGRKPIPRTGAGKLVPKAKLGMSVRGHYTRPSRTVKRGAGQLTGGSKIEAKVSGSYLIEDRGSGVELTGTSTLNAKGHYHSKDEPPAPIPKKKRMAIMGPSTVKKMKVFGASTISSNSNQPDGRGALSPAAKLTAGKGSYVISDLGSGAELTSIATMDGKAKYVKK